MEEYGSMNVVLCTMGQSWGFIMSKNVIMSNCMRIASPSEAHSIAKHQSDAALSNSFDSQLLPRGTKAIAFRKMRKGLQLDV